MPPSIKITWHPSLITEYDRENLLRQRGCVLWFTGLSGSGKSTIATALEKQLINSGHAAYILDGDNIRHGLNSDLDFSPESRHENIRRVSEVASLFADAGLITITAFISPYRADREQARAIIEKKAEDTYTAPHHRRFIEIYLNTPLAVCEQRDPKKLYAKARAGEIPDFTGISAPYEPPLSPEIELPTDSQTVDSSVAAIMHKLAEFNLIPSSDISAN